MSWPEVRLDSICKFLYGKSLPASSRTQGECRVFGSNGQVGTHNSSITNGPTIVIGRKGSFGEVNYSDSSCWPIDTTYYIDNSSVTEGIDLRWLFHRISALGLTHLNRAAAIPGLNRDDAYRLKLLLPPYEEQQRIAGVLDHLDAAREQRRKAIALLDELIRSVHSELIGDIESKVITKRPLSTIIKVRSGQFLPAKEMVNEGAYPVYGGNGVNGYHNQYLFEESKIVIGRVGFYCGSIHVSPPRSWITDNALYVEKLDHSIDDLYLEWTLRLADLNRYASRSAQPLISGSRIYPIEISVPSVESQKRFRTVVEQTEELRASHLAHLAELDALFTSVQRRAFRGELWETSSD
jgi:type I restriction enzyme, S subunit